MSTTAQTDDAPLRARYDDKIGDVAFVGRSVTINRPRQELFSFWRDSIAKLFAAEPNIQARHELKRFKMLMEAGEIANSSWHH